MEKNLRRALLSCAGCTLMLFVTCGLAFNVFFRRRSRTSWPRTALPTRRPRSLRRSVRQRICSVRSPLAGITGGSATAPAARWQLCWPASASCCLRRQKPRGLLFCRSRRGRQLCARLDGTGVDPDASLVPGAFRAGYRDLLRRNRTGDRRVFAAVYRHCRIQRR